jgi:purine-binding chemotaxis protein CheW
MVVDSVSEVLRLDVAQIEPAPEMITGVDTEYIRGVGKIEDRLIILLDLAKIITGSEKRELDSADVEAAAAA